MNGESALRGLANQLGSIEEETTTLSEQVLQDQETHYAETVDQVKHSLKQLVEDNEFIFEPVPQPTDIDLRCIPKRISDLGKLAEQLKTTHLEQEMLDNFLRYTIPSADLLQMESSQDERFVSLSENVHHLRDEVITELDSDVNELKHEIGQASQKIADQREVVNELCLDTGELVDQCHTLLQELENSTDRLETEQEGESREIYDVPSTEETLTILQSLKEKLSQKSHLEHHIEHLEQTKTSLSSILETRDQNVQESNSALIDACMSYDALIQFWSNKLIHKEIKNLEVFPKSGKFQFTFQKVEIVISLSHLGTISKVELYGNGIPLDKVVAARQHVNQVATSGAQLYRQTIRVLNIVKEYATIL
ncbi:LANO_0G00672g1_1 [Lachancea nothofagi CBS 11611]|uniref:Spindle pole body component KRE28 n=1 Tax=Lachancea nothofagi CBS 11611 TaxID=1266666 RepID=A0A1G4KEH9_9SACH|nr:LANO_0G00672g1_1 [Lachancea nothofagi CBS 11611]